MKLTSLMIAALLGTGLATAQGYYDDDIYFDASKAKKAAKTTRVVKEQYASYPAADTYTPEGTSTRSVDEYNRRGIFAVPHASDSISVDSLAALGDFSNTRRIERFYNPDVITTNPDQELAEIYYAESTPANVNIYINDPYWGWSYPYYGYDPFWSPAWAWGWGGPSWSWNWGWGPSWGWGWGPSWGWGWGPSWSWNWGWGPSWGWGGPAWGWGPSIPAPPKPGRPINGTRPGASDTHYAGSYRRASNGYRSSTSASNWSVSNVGSRPAGSQRPSTGTNNGSSQQYRPGAGGNSYRGGSLSNRNTNSNNGSYRREQNTQNRNNTSTYRNQNTGSYRSGSSGGSFRGGSMGGSMGGSRSTGGGGGSYRGGGGRR